MNNKVRSTSLSWSKYLSLKSCPLQYSLIYEQEILMPKPKIPFLVGSVVHDAIKIWASRRYPIGFIEGLSISLFRNQARYMNLGHKGIYTKLLRRSINGAYIASRIYRLLQFPEHKAMIEERFKVPLPNDNLLVGIIDVYDPITKTIYDLKMHIKSNILDRDQILTYSLAKILQDRKVKQMGFILPFKLNKVKIEPITKNDIDTHYKKLLITLKNIKTGIKPIPTKGRHCFFCGFKKTQYCSVD